MTATSVFIGLLILSIHDPAGPQNPQAETTGRRVSITKNVPILRIDHASIKGKLLGVWQISYIGGVLDLEEINPPPRSFLGTFLQRNPVLESVQAGA
jgi:hypothetical protein